MPDPRIVLVMLSMPAKRLPVASSFVASNSDACSGSGKSCEVLRLGECRGEIKPFDSRLPFLLNETGDSSKCSDSI